MRRVSGFVGIATGIAIAWTHHYSTVAPVGGKSFPPPLAIVLRPLVLLGINLHVRG